MARLIIVPNTETNSKCKIGCYSERGCFSYLFFRYLTQSRNFYEFLGLIGFPLIKDFSENDINEYTLFSELNLGGFGSPDGGFLFVVGGNKYFVFVEGKFNESYTQSLNLGIGSDKYASTIKGQVELKYRMIYSWLKLNNNVHNPEIIVENVDIASFYGKKNDSYYTNTAHDVRVKKAESNLNKLNHSKHSEQTINNKKNEINNKQYRRLKVVNGIKTLFEALPIKIENFYYLMITKDISSPIIDRLDPNDLPCMYTKPGEYPPHLNLLWVNSTTIEALIMEHGNQF